MLMHKTLSREWFAQPTQSDPRRQMGAEFNAPKQCPVVCLPQQVFSSRLPGGGRSMADKGRLVEISRYSDIKALVLPKGMVATRRIVAQPSVRQRLIGDYASFP